MNSLYEELGVARDADPEVIKRAYRRRAKETHTDKGGDREEFHKVQRAYDVLSDPERRSHYDATGDAGGDAQDQESQDRLAVVEIWQTAIAHLDPWDDLVEWVRQIIEQSKPRLQDSIEKANGQRKRFEDMLGRLSGAAAGLLREVLESKIAEQALLEANLAKAIAQADRMLNLLEGVIYRAGNGEQGLKMEDLLQGLKKGSSRRRRGPDSSFFSDASFPAT
jgi:curved DNA-binding protein CbpA